MSEEFSSFSSLTNSPTLSGGKWWCFWPTLPKVCSHEMLQSRRALCQICLQHAYSKYIWSLPWEFIRHINVSESAVIKKFSWLWLIFVKPIWLWNSFHNNTPIGILQYTRKISSRHHVCISVYIPCFLAFLAYFTTLQKHSHSLDYLLKFLPC